MEKSRSGLKLGEEVNVPEAIYLGHADGRRPIVKGKEHAATIEVELGEFCWVNAAARRIEQGVCRPEGLRQSR